MEDLIKDMEFIKEMDKMKSVLRMTSPIGGERREDDAQHSWHIALMAMVLKDYADSELDIDRVIKMLLVHDIVEIYAGDTFAYDTKGYEDKKEREEEAARKLYSILSGDKGRKLKMLWEEFEEEKTREALFATAMDRIQPILLNYYNNGGTWKTHGIGISKIYKRIEPVKEISEKLWTYTSSLLEDACKKGDILEDRNI